LKEAKVSNGLKITFLIHAIISIIFGLGLYLVPVQFGATIGWPQGDTTMARLTGNALIAFGISSWLAYRATNWEQVRIILITEIWLTILGALIALYSALYGGAPSFIWANFAIFVVFAVLWIYFYMKGPQANKT
jgi:hypothetical protein